ncbi:hypothetical protein BYT27DRAFT_7183897 [Phlegmacium glaucopus]|nr:hypothetical protein BYT27DRAFT_7183897 [Phlegmacium glaucopus]
MQDLKDRRAESQSFLPKQAKPRKLQDELTGANNSNHNSLKIALLMHKNNWKWLC